MVFPALLLALADTTVFRRSGAGCAAESLFTRVPVYVRPIVAVRADTAAASSLLLIAEAVATRIRVALGGSPVSVPRGDSLLARRGPPAPGDSTAADARTPEGIDSAGLRVVVRRDGSLRWTPVRTPVGPATTLLDRALADVVKTEESFVVPEQFSADSLVFTLGYYHAFDVVRGRVVARAYGPATMVAFTLLTPVQRVAAAIPGTIRPIYPEVAKSGGADGFVQLSFVVDTMGRAEMSTARDVWPKDRPRLTGRLGDYYDAFVRAAMDAVSHARFYPAEVAGCKVKERVLLPLTFTLTR